MMGSLPQGGEDDQAMNDFFSDEVADHLADQMCGAFEEMMGSEVKISDLLQNVLENVSENK